jgi:hypothetical protein
VSGPEPSRWENGGQPLCSVQQYLNEDYKGWPDDWEGDFDYVDGKLQRHDWGDLAVERCISG